MPRTSPVPAQPSGPAPRRAWILVGLLAAGCSDKNVGVVHEPPVVTIASPSEGATFFQGQSVHFEALVQSFDSSAMTDITHTWVSGTETICSSAAVDAEGNATCDWTFDEVGEHTVTVTVTDPQLDTASATVTVNIQQNTPPDITLVSPLTGAFFQPGDLIVFEALVADAEDNAEDLVVSVVSSLDGDLGLGGAPSSSGTWTGAGTLSNGDHLITVEVVDSAGRTDQDTATISVNARPGAPSVEIHPDPSPSGLPLQAEITAPADDPEGDAVTYRFDWYLDGALYQSGSNDAIARGVTVRGQFWEVYAYPDDGYGYGDPGYDSLTIENSAPSLDAVNILPSLPSTVDDLVATPSGWFDQDGDGERYRYAWYLNDALDGGETTATFPSAKTTRGDLVRVELTPYDDDEDGPMVSSATIVIQNSPPTEPTVEISPAEPEPGQDLYCEIVATSSDADDDPISYRYEWYKDGVLQSVTTNVVDGSLTSHGDGWECVLYPSDGVDEGDEAHAYVTVNDGSAPAAPVINEPRAFRNDETVTLTGTCEADCDLVFTCFDSLDSWTGTDVCDGDGTFSWSTAVDRGEVSSCSATCTDAAGNTSPNSNTVSTEVCDPYDTYEDAAGYGDDGIAAIGEWSSIGDDGATTITIEGNVLDDDDEDWYVISARDDVADDRADYLDYFNFEVRLAEGTGAYEFHVYYDAYDATALECTSAVNEYGWFNQDVGDGSHAIPADYRSCGASGDPLRNTCADDSATWYIQVERKASVSMSCESYELEITNGVW